MVIIFGVLLLLGTLPAAECGYESSPITSIHENHDDSKDMWTIVAYCTVRYTTSYTCSYQQSYSCVLLFTCYRTAFRTCYVHAYSLVQCNRCIISSDSSGHFQMSSLTVQKKECTDKYCGPTCSATGCLNGGDSHSVGVTCSNPDYEGDGAISTSFTVSVTNAAAPTFYYSEGTSIDVYKSSSDEESVINTIVASYIDDSSDYDNVRYVQNSGPAVSYIHSTADLFYLDTSTGEVKVGKSLSSEFSYYYSMNLCVYDRRDRNACHTLSITLHACFQTPNCTDRTNLNLHDTFGTYTGHGGSSNVFLEMDYPDPSKHFVDFSTVWHDLTWSFDSNEFPEAAIDADTGNIYVTSNISIWPAWPTKEYYQTVRVSNSESCYSTTCQMRIIVHYTNWPISITSLPTSYDLHEDTDAETLVHSLVVFDYNYESEDNVTCNMTNISPSENNLFELKHDGGNAWNSYRIYKMVCKDPDCGYKAESYLCDTNIGCMNHNLTQQYVVTIKCDDAYNTTDTQDFTFNVIKNSAPTYSNLANHIDLDRSVVSHLDTVFSILYWDLEEERLYYEYTYADDDTGIDPGYFIGSPSGNFYNDLGNITMTVYLADKDANTTYRIHICGHERRNEICDDLTIDIEEYCGESPACNDASISVTTEFTVGDQLFDISSLVTGPTLGTPYKGLNYAISSIESSLFGVDSSTGVVTTRDTLTTNFPDSIQKTYTLIGFVYDQGACGYGTCSLGINVTAVNYAVQIDNLPATVWIHEDTLDTETLFTVSASDANEDDTYECRIVNTMSVEPFYLDRVPPVSGLYKLQNRDSYPLSTATLTYTISIMCEDTQGASDTQELTVEVIENEAPTLTNLVSPTAQNMNPMDYVKGDTAYIVEATDTEGDDLSFICSVATNYVPFECYQESGWNYAIIRFRRNLHIYNDDGSVLCIDVCVSDTKHTNASCGTLEVTFTRDLTPPEITNLPDTVNVPEDSSIGDTIFTAVITDPDVGETHVVTMTVNPNRLSNKFQLDTSSGTLTLGGKLDYEDVNYYEITFDVRDDRLEALSKKILAINVTNVNEGNTITADITSVTFYENMTSNTMFEDLGIICTDIDNDETTIEITTGVDSDHFGFNQITNRISLIEEFDYEVDSSSVLLTITCSDGELDSSLVIYINVLDVNDNQPSLVVTFGDINTAILISASTSLSEVLISVSASDADAGANDDFNFEIAGKGIALTYFRLLAKSSTEADLKLKKIPDFSNDKTFPLTILACDNFGGTDDKCGGLTFTVNFTAGDPDDKTKESAKCLTCTRSGRVLVALLATEGVIIVIFVIHFIYSIYCRRNKVIKLSDFDKSSNTRFKSTNFSKPSVNLSRRTTLQTTVKPAVTRQQQTKQRTDELSSSDSSTSSSSDDDDKITEMSHRNDVGRVKFQHGAQRMFAHASLPPPILAPSFTGLPTPIYSSNASESHGLTFRK